MSKRIGITGAGGTVAISLIKCLRQANFPEEIEIIALDAEIDSGGLYLADEAQLIPRADEDNFIEELTRIANHKDLDMLIPCVEWELHPISENIEKFNLPVIVPNEKALNKCSNKWKLYQSLEKLGMNTPRTVDVESFLKNKNELEYPRYLKKKISYGSKGQKRVESKKEAENFFSQENIDPKEYISQKEVQGVEFTVGVYLNKKSEISVIPVRRKAKEGCTTYKAWIEQNSEITQMCEDYVNHLVYEENMQGPQPLNIQFFESNGKYYLFEINPRFSGSTCIRPRFGFHDVKATVKETLFDDPGMKFEDLEQGTVFRFWDEIYVDESEYERASKEKRLKGSPGNVSNYFS